MNTFYVNTYSSTITPFSPETVYVEDIFTPILPTRQYITTYPIKNSYGPSYRSSYGPSQAYYYDSGIGENTLAQEDTNKDLRYRFLDKWLYQDFPNILRMLKVEGDYVKVVSRDEAKENDIGKDSESVLKKKSDYIAREILTMGKNRKILSAILAKNIHMKWYDLPHSKSYVKKSQGKYVEKKLQEMQNKL